MNKEILLMSQNNFRTFDISLIINTIDQNDIDNFRNFLKLCYNNIKLLNYLFFYCNKDNNFKPLFLSTLINLGVDPNTIIDNPNNYINMNINNKKNKNISNNDIVGKSVLMLACENSCFSLVKDLCEINNKINKKQNHLSINYIDKNGRNALFYLKGGNDDKKIIELLVKKGIEINRRDKDDNTPLYFIILNIMKGQLIYDMIETGGADFMTKNKDGKNGLDLINDILIVRKNQNNLINNFADLKPLIKLLKNKLSIKLYSSNKLNDNNSETDYTDNNSRDNNNNNNNLIKLSSLSSVKSINNANNEDENNNEGDSHNIFVKLNPLSLIVDTEFNDHSNINSTSEKKKYYTQMNKNKKYFLNLLKNAENHIKENSKLIEQKIMEKKEQVKKLQSSLKEKGVNYEEINNNYSKKIDDLKKDLNNIKKKINEKKQDLLKEKSNYLFDIKSNSNFLQKYNYSMINKELKNEYIYSQLQVDLIDFMTYVHNKNEKLEPILEKLNTLVQQSVKYSLGEDYQLKMYGSRATKLCLPWSDIDYVISSNKTIHFEPLKKLYEYLLEIYDKFFSDMKYIAGASIPVLKIFTNDEYHKISLDISIENPEHHGEECVNYIKQKIKEYEVLTPLTLALKTILQKACLNDPYVGGLSSYGVILLIIHFLNVQQKKGNDISIKSLGKLFYDILYYYGSEYDITNPIIVGENENTEKIISIHQFQLMRNEFILVDPLNISNNVARNTRQFQNIKLAFQIGYVSAKESCECGCHYQYEGVNIKEEGCGHNLLNRIFNDVKRERKY